MAILSLDNVGKGYGTVAGRTAVLRDITLSIKEGEFVAIVGFSGSGKTTLISLMAGLIEPDAGRVCFKGTAITGPGPERGVVFQNYSLMPWLTVRGNVALAVDATHGHELKTVRGERVKRYVDLVGLGGAIDQHPAALSGGMRQRVAVARALAMNPEILLLDEPLSALDALTRAKLQDEIEDIWSRERKTVVLVTNDVDEAMLLADRIIPLNPGPGATLGPEFKVNLPRPRNRAAMNDDPEFKRLRTAVNQYLIDVGIKRIADDDSIVLPDVTPVSFVGPPPKAYRDRAASPIETRYVEFSQVTKIYPSSKGPVTIVDAFDLKMTKGEFVSLIGHSGCGKSTVLSMAAGLNPISSGGVVLDGREAASAGPDRAVVFQAPSLFPWLTAAENVAIGVDRVYPRASRQERADVVAYYLSRVGLAGSMHKRAVELSNGMRQRVGIARAFALSPKLLLLDEPFGMLDSLTRWELQQVLMEVWTRTRVTAICVTHDIDEAILLADRVVMMTNGPMARIGATMTIDIPRPRTRRMLLDHPRYYQYRNELLQFLKEYEQGSVARTQAGARTAA